MCSHSHVCLSAEIKVALWHAYKSHKKSLSAHVGNKELALSVQIQPSPSGADLDPLQWGSYVGKLHREEENLKVPDLCSNLETKSNDLLLCVDNHFIFHWYFTGERRVGFSETRAITYSLLGEGSILPRVLPSQWTSCLRHATTWRGIKAALNLPHFYFIS